jgi:hypothetical protein
MKFVDERGQILNIYQQPTLLADEHLLSLPWVSGQVPALAAEEAVEVSRTLLRRSLDGAYSALTAQFHLDPFAIGGQAGADEAHWLEGTLDYAAAEGVPIWSAWEWLRFTETRHDTSLVDLQWNADQQRLSFELSVPEDPDAELAVMLPLRHGDAALVQVDLDGRTVGHQVREVGGVSYGWIATPAGSHRVAATYS